MKHQGRSQVAGDAESHEGHEVGPVDGIVPRFRGRDAFQGPLAELFGRLRLAPGPQIAQIRPDSGPDTGHDADDGADHGRTPDRGQAHLEFLARHAVVVRIGADGHLLHSPLPVEPLPEIIFRLQQHFGKGQQADDHGHEADAVRKFDDPEGETQGTVFRVSADSGQQQPQGGGQQPPQGIGRGSHGDDDKREQHHHAVFRRTDM